MLTIFDYLPQDSLWNLVIDSKESKHSFYKYMQQGGWGTNKPSIKYNAQNEGQEYKWKLPPVRDEDKGISWEQTMFSIGMKIGHDFVIQKVWDLLENKDSIVLNVMWFL